MLTMVVEGMLGIPLLALLLFVSAYLFAKGKIPALMFVFSCIVAIGAWIEVLLVSR